MSLQIPTRKSPKQSSFPTSPAGVETWVTSLDISDNGGWIQSLYRGLKHSNRLEINNRTRVEILKVLEPHIDDALDQLAGIYFQQPLPLSRKISNAHQLGSSLLHELGFAWKIVVQDTYSSLLQGHNSVRAQAILRALRVLAKSILHHSLVYSSVPEGLIADANTLYRMAEKSDLHKQALVMDDEDEWLIEQAYLHLQLLSLIDLHTQRRSQIPLISNYLESLTEQIKLSKAKKSHPLSKKQSQTPNMYAIHLDQDSPPLDWRQCAPIQTKSHRVMDMTECLAQIETDIKTAPEAIERELETTVLYKSSLRRIQDQLLNSSSRENQRLICNQPVAGHTGLKDIHTLLQRISSKQASNAERIHVLQQSDSESWRIVNKTSTGICLEWDSSRSSDLQIGELIALITTDAPEYEIESTDDNGSSMPTVQIGNVRWVNYRSNNRLVCGIQLLSDEVTAVLVETTSVETEGTRQECLLCISEAEAPVTDHPTSQMRLPERTLLTPPHAFDQSSTLRLHHRGKTSEWQVQSKPVANGGFDFLALQPAS